jgi:hypothetical protein
MLLLGQRRLWQDAMTRQLQPRSLTTWVLSLHHLHLGHLCICQGCLQGPGSTALGVERQAKQPYQVFSQERRPMDAAAAVGRISCDMQAAGPSCYRCDASHRCWLDARLCPVLPPGPPH